MVAHDEAIYYAEVYDILNYLGSSYIDKVPKKLMMVINGMRDKNYVSKIDGTKKLSEIPFMEDTRSMIAGLNLMYWVTDEEEKKKLTEHYKENEEKYQKELSEKYSYENLFKDNSTTIVSSENNKEAIKANVEPSEQSKNVQMIEYKESFIQKIVSKIKNFFSRLKK